MPSHRLPVAAAAAAAIAVGACTVRTNAPAGGVAPARGAELFARHCAVCHGEAGDADAVVAEFLMPRPTAFRDGLFKLASTENGMPTEEDLIATLRRGMPGSSMFAFHWLPEEDLRLLAAHVRSLAIDGRAAAIERAAAASGQPIGAAEARRIAAAQLQPGPRLDTGKPAPATAATLAEGERLYRLHCANCHGTDGRGQPPPPDWPTGSSWLWPRDFTAGYLRGGTTHHDLACRIRAGMPGAHMPASLLATAEVGALVAYVKGLIPDTAADHHVQWRRTVRAARIAQLPDPGDARGLAGVEAIRLPLAPLWWRPGSIDSVLLRAVHDGAALVLELQWADATRDDRVRPGASMGDGAAIQFERSPDPPLLAMGSPQAPVNVWRWRAFDAKETAGLVDLLGRFHAGLDVPIATVPRPRSESVQLSGVGSTDAATSSGLPLDVVTTWRDGRWTATFRRPLEARQAGEIDLKQREAVRFAIAIWDGGTNAHAGSKSITTWHVLELQR